VLLAVELCSLSVPASEPDMADLVVSMLFGDGAAAVVLHGDGVVDQASDPLYARPRIRATRSAVVPDTSDVLGWRLRDDGFRIVLTTELSEVVAGHLGGLVRDFLAAHELKIDDVTAWVCHPGGPRVLDAVRDALGLPESALATARASLAEVGNLSSASVLHVLEKTLAAGTDARPAPGSPGLLIGLGPGVSIELVLVEW
jgi:alkylresorcinol/alkylpyrone synthase